MNLLNILGYRPSLEFCSRCGAGFGPIPARIVGTELLCSNCGITGRGVSPETPELLSRCLMTGRFGTVDLEGAMHDVFLSRKDVRDAVRAARGAFPGWAGATAYNRGQVLYRLAEMLEARADDLARVCSGRKEVEAAIDRLADLEWAFHELRQAAAPDAPAPAATDAPANDALSVVVVSRDQGRLVDATLGVQGQTSIPFEAEAGACYLAAAVRLRGDNVGISLAASVGPRLAQNRTSEGAVGTALAFCAPASGPALLEVESRGLVRRQPSPEDRRVKVLVLTSTGTRVRSVLIERLTSAPPELERLSPAEKRALVRILGRLLGS